MLVIVNDYFSIPQNLEGVDEIMKKTLHTARHETKDMHQRRIFFEPHTTNFSFFWALEKEGEKFVPYL